MCALDWADCLRDPGWNFCMAFPEICEKANAVQVQEVTGTDGTVTRTATDAAGVTSETKIDTANQKMTVTVTDPTTGITWVRESSAAGIKTTITDTKANTSTIREEKPDKSSRYIQSYADGTKLVIDSDSEGKEIANTVVDCKNAQINSSTVTAADGTQTTTATQVCHDDPNAPADPTPCSGTSCTTDPNVVDTQTETLADGSTKKTETMVDGSKSETITMPDGSSTKTDTAVDGKISTTQTTVNADGSSSVTKVTPDGSRTEIQNQVDGGF
jgi:hypothetical protein